MYFVTKFCCFCLHEKDNLINVNNTNFNNVNIMNKLMFCVTSDFSTVTIPIYICLKCCSKLESAYEFKRRCLGNFNRFLSYDQKLSNKEKFVCKEMGISISELKFPESIKPTITNKTNSEDVYCLIKRCCFCLNEEGNLINLNGRQFENINVLNKVMFCINQDFDTKIPTFICTKCCTKLESTYQFKKICLGSFNRFQSYLRKLKYVNMHCKTRYVFKKIKIFVSDLQLCEVKLEERDFETQNENRAVNESIEDKNGNDSVGLLSTLVDRKHNQQWLDFEDNVLIIEKMNDKCAEALNKTGEDKTLYFMKHDPTCNSDESTCLKQETPLNEIEEITELESIESPIVTNTSIPVINERASLKCLKCGQCFTTKQLYDSHTELHKNTPEHTCTVCGKVYSSDEQLQFHTANFHPDLILYPFECPACDMSYITKLALDKHIKQFHHLNGSIQLENVDKAGLYKFSRMSHKINKLNLCFVCKKKFSSQQELKSHVLSHSNEAPFMCSTCGKGFKAKTYLTRHMYTHNEDQRPWYYCSKCEKRYTTKFLLKAHLVTHENKLEDKVERLSKNCDEIEIVENPIKTELNVEDIAVKYNQILQGQICGDENKILINRFDSVLNKKDNQTEKSTLNEDTLSEKFRPCPICGKRIVNLKRHMDIHNKKDRPQYNCSVCEKQFITKISFKLHLLNHNNIKHPYQSHKEVEPAFESLGKSTPDKIEIQDDSETCESEKSEEIKVESQDLNAFDEAIKINDENLKQSYRSVINIEDENLHPENLREKAPVFEIVFIKSNPDDTNLKFNIGDLKDKQTSIEKENKTSSLLEKDDTIILEPPKKVSSVNQSLLCPACNQTFDCQSTLSSHTCVVIFQCSVCLKRFKTELSLDYHISLYHESDQLYKCTNNKCYKSFNSKFCLERHMERCQFIYD